MKHHSNAALQSFRSLKCFENEKKKHFYNIFSFQFSFVSIIITITIYETLFSCSFAIFQILKKKIEKDILLIVIKLTKVRI